MAVAPQVVCHGDVHPGNVLMSADGPVVIDWDMVCAAPAAWDHSALLTWEERWGGTPGLYASFAAGYGLDIALGCDIRVAAASAKLNPGFAKRGILPESGGTWLMPRIVGYAKAAEIAFTGRTLKSDEALELGLVNRVVDDARRRRVRPVEVDPADSDPVDTSAPFEMPDLQTLSTLLEALTPDQKEVLWLRFGADLSVEETARTVGKNPDAVAALTMRALRRLRKLAGG